MSWYAAPDGSPRGDGSTARPWDIATALRHPAVIEPGDIVWLLGGTYRPQAPLKCLLSGTETAPIQVWGDPEGEPAIVDLADGRPHGLHVRGKHAWYGDFEVRCTAEDRWSDIPESEGNPRGTGLLCETGLGVKLIRLTLRDFGTSLFESQPSGIEIVGCAIFNSYWDAPDRSHGPGLYIRNPKGAPRKRIVDNVVFQHGRQGLQGFGSTPFAEMDVVGNTFFNNGIARDGFHRNFMFGNASADHENVIFEDNTAYFAPGKPLGHEANQAGGVGGSRGLTLRGNWLAHRGRPALRVSRAEDATIDGNRFVGDVSFTSLDGTIDVSGQAFADLFPDNAYHDDTNEPAGVWVRIRRDEALPDDWRPKGRAWVTVLNWQELPEVDIDLSGLEGEGGLEIGTTVEIRPVQAWGTAIERTYQGASVRVPMTGWSAMRPVGRDPGVPLPSTFPELGVFSLEWPTQGEPAEREQQQITDPGAGLSRSAAQAARAQAWSSTDEAERASLLDMRRAQWRAHTLGREL